MALIPGTNGNDDDAVGGRSLIGTSESDIINGLLGNDFILGNGGAHDQLFGDGGNDFITALDGGNHFLGGGTGDDQLFSGNGNDTLEGGSGNDIMQGGAGDDIYLVDSNSDAIIEFGNQGFDSINSFITFTLPVNIERLRLLGNGDVDGTGNDLFNSIEGNDRNNTLKGGGGNDSLIGRAGNNVLDGGTGFNTVAESADVNFTLTSASLKFGTSVDTLINIQEAVLTSGASDNTLDASAFKGRARLFGEGGNDRIIGGAGSDFLEGGDDNDRLTGGAGDDGLNGGNGTDGVIETGNVNFTLTNTSLKGNSTDTLLDIEFAELSGGSGDNIFDTTGFDLGNVTLFGKAGNDTLKTGKGGDTLRGDTGNDTMNGGAGNDTYFVDSTLDQVIEASATGGSDTVFSSASFTLGANVENLTLSGTTGSTTGTGNALDNTIAGDANSNILKGKDGKDTLTGGLGSDILIGGNGSDTLSGNGGNDRFVFDTGAAFNNTTIGLDTIKDFINFGSEDDRLVLDKTTFTALKSVAGDGFSVGSDFALISSNSAAATSSALITYNTTTGELIYNQNGASSGFGTGGQFASLSNHPALSATDFVIQA